MIHLCNLKFGITKNKAVDDTYEHFTQYACIDSIQPFTYFIFDEIDFHHKHCDFIKRFLINTDKVKG